MKITKPEIADLTILDLANEHDKFAVGSVPPAHRFAFERGINQGLYTLVDVTPIAEFPDQMGRSRCRLAM